VIETNLSSVFYTCRAVARPMMKKRAGAIVNVSSIVGVHGNWGQTNYAASKAGIIGFTKSLARELGSRNVRANVVAPGYVRSQLTDVLPEEATDPTDASAAFEDAGAVRFLSPTRRHSSRAKCCSSTAAVALLQDRQRRVVVTGSRQSPATRRDTWAGLTPLRRGPDHAVRFDRLRRALRL
jgi:NAD(P)-dependent dehydrogenase (short-subunit alcohol dehydrogenase family)